MTKGKPINRKLLIELHSKYEGKNWRQITNEYNEIEKDEKASGTLRAHYSRHKEKFETFIEVENVHSSTRYQELATDKFVTEDELLEMHGYDPELFQLTSSNSTRSKIGTKAEEGYFINTYSKITAKPREWKLTEEILNDTLKKSFNNKIKKVFKPNTNKHNNGYMLIPYKDMHIKSAKQYEKHQQETYNLIKSKHWKEIAFIIGSDLFNTNDSRGRTYNDTQVDNMDTDLSYRMIEARKFYEPLIDIALQHSLKVHVIYEPGNHDRDTALSFVTALSWIYEDNDHITFDLKDEDYKLIKFNEGKIVIATHHGDKKSTVKSASETFQRYFGRELALSDYCEGLIGHKHHRWSGEHMNLFIQGLSTASDDTDWEIRMGFANGYKAFTMRFYDDYGLKDTPVINGSTILDYE